MAAKLPVRLINALTEDPWLIRGDWAEAIRVSIALVHAEAGTPDEIREKLRATFAPLAQPKAAAADYGQPLEGARSTTVRDGVAILPVMGPMFHYASFMAELCGHTTYEALAADLRIIRQAKAEGIVHATVLEVDSPGGQVGGCADTAKLIRALSEVMPVTAFISSLGCSAAMWLAAAAGRVVISETAMAGSVGAVASFRVRRGGAAAEEIVIVSSQSPKKVLDLNSEEGQAEVQTMVDDLAQVFIEDLARYRGVSVEKVLADFGQGGVMVGRKAVAAGLVDEVGTLEELLAELAGARPAAAGGTSITLSQEPIVDKEKNAAPAGEAKPEPAPQALTAASVVEQHPAVAAELRRAGADAERTRILGIQELGAEGDEEIIAACVTDPSISVEAAAVKLVKARNERAAAGAAATAKAGTSYLKEVKAAEKELDPPAPGGDAAGNANPDDARAAEIIGLGRTVLGASIIKPEVKHG